MALNTTTSLNFTTDGQALLTTAEKDHSGYSIKGDTITLIIILITALGVLLLSTGGILYCILQRRKNTKSYDSQRGTIIGHGGDEENSSTRNSRESGSYRSYDAINVDILREIHVEKPPDPAQEQSANERKSKESTASGAYRSFDDFETIIPDLNMPDYHREMYFNRDSNYDFDVPEEELDDIEREQNDTQSFREQLESRINMGSIKGYNSNDEIRNNYEMFQDAHHEIDNPLFSEAFNY